MKTLVLAVALVAAIAALGIVAATTVQADKGEAAEHASCTAREHMSKEGHTNSGIAAAENPRQC